MNLLEKWVLLKRSKLLAEFTEEILSAGVNFTIGEVVARPVGVADARI